MRGISHVWLRFAFALLLTLAVTALTFPRSIGLTRTASLETISPGQGLLYEAPWPRSLRRASQRTILPEEKPSLTENGQVLGVWVSKRSAIEQVGAGRFRFTGNKVQFSSSDGTSPLNNGRIYAVSTGSLRVREPLLLLSWAITLCAWLPYYHHSEEQLRAQRFGSCHCCGERLLDCVANSTCRCPETRPWSAFLFLSALADSCSRCPFSRA